MFRCVVVRRDDGITDRYKIREWVIWSAVGGWHEGELVRERLERVA